MIVLRMRNIVFTSVLLGIFAIVFSVIIAVLSPFDGRVIPPDEPDDLPAATSTPHPRMSMLDLSDSKSMIRFLHNGEIKEISMCDYLIGAVSAEMPAAFELEALCAQAVTLRTYVLYQVLLQPPANHPDADVCGDFGCCAAYQDDEALREKWGDMYEECIAKVEAAVRQTDGIYITYDDQPILAVFHSSSYRATTGAEKVWKNPLPYLKGVPSPETEDDVANLKSTVTVTKSDFRATVLNSYPDAKFGDDARTWISDMQFDESGRVDTIVIGGVNITGPQLRALFMLRSTAVSITIGDDIVFETMGYGHGVGMSQYGANIMAKNGLSWRGIIKTYYTGVSLSDETEPAAPAVSPDDMPKDDDETGSLTSGIISDISQDSAVDL